MAPKKTKATADTADAGAGAGADSEKGQFRWTAELDAKLLCLITIPRSVSKEDHQTLADKLGVPTAGGVRNRVSKLKIDHRVAYEEAGLAMPSGIAPAKSTRKDTTKTSKPATPRGKKRAAKDVDIEAGDDEVVSKKTKVDDGGLGDGYGIEEEDADDADDA